MADPDVTRELGGAAAWFLGLMAAAITALAGGNALQWKMANKVTGYRLKERDDLITAVKDSTAARVAATHAQEEHNRVIDELADAIRALAQSHDRQAERLALQAEHIRERELDRQQIQRENNSVIQSLAESVRTTGAIASDIRNHLSKQGII